MAADAHSAALKKQWEADVEIPLAERGIRPPRIVLRPAPYRRMHEPLLEFIAKLDADIPGRSAVVLIPRLVTAHAWERLLQTGRGDRGAAGVRVEISGDKLKRDALPSGHVEWLDILHFL